MKRISLFFLPLAGCQGIMNTLNFALFAFLISGSSGETVFDVELKAGEPYVLLQSEGYPNQPMPYDSSIQWNFKVQDGDTINIYCSDIRMGQHQPWTPECEYVRLSFIEVNGEETRICGRNEKRKKYFSKGSTLTVKIYSNGASGFVKCSAHNSKEPEPILIDLYTNGNIQLISTKEIPEPYLDRVWLLKSSPNTRISLQCEFSLENVDPCFTEKLLIDTGNEIKEYCGANQTTVLTNSNYGKVRLQILNKFGDNNIRCLVQAVTGPHANEFLNVVSEEVDSSELGVTNGTQGTSCRCGWRNSATRRIINGDEVAEHEYPWMVLLIMFMPGYVSSCGASIITQRHVLTAAHCIHNKYENRPLDPENVEMVFAEHHTEKTSGREKRLRAKQIFVHENYIKSGSHDIGLIYTEENIEFSDIIGPVCIEPIGPDVTNKKTTLIGWGQTEHGRGSDVLLYTKLTVVDNLLCKLPDFELCTYSAKRSSSCYGDSGGPMVWLDPQTNRYTQVSLVSRGTHNICAMGMSIYTRVSSFYDWIQAIIKETEPTVFTCNKI